MTDMLTIKTGITGDNQQANFMNATLNVIGDGENDLAVSILVETPDHFENAGAEEVERMLREDFKHLTDIGYRVEIQIGPDQERDEDDEDYDDDGNLKAGCGHNELA
jgi:hypothetical protein